MTSKSDLVNLRQGTDSSYYFSTGNTLPVVSRPFGMNHWTVQTEESDPRFFQPSSHCFRGVRLTHQASPWMQDYAAMLMLPQTGEIMLEPHRRTSVFNQDELNLKPYELSVFLRRYRTSLRLVPAGRTALCSIDFPEAPGPRRIIFDALTADTKFSLDGRTFSGYLTNNHGGVPDNFRFHVLVEFDCEPLEMVRSGSVFAVEIPADCSAVNLRIATSFIGPEQARQNMRHELDGLSIDGLADAGREIWNDLLSRIEFEDSEERLRTFYSCFYRTQLFPREFHEFDVDGKPVHYSPYDGEIHPGVLYADNGFWDTHRTVYPLFSILFPARYAEILQGWTNAAKEGRAFPRWSSPGYHNCMIGTHIDNIVADAVAKNITGFDLETAYEYLKKNAFEPGDKNGKWGRTGIAEYMELGYVPDDEFPYAASRTMDYAFNDHGVAVVADYLGDTEVRDRLLKRSLNYRNIFNPEAGCLQGRRRDGSFAMPFDPFRWGGTYVEGSSFQCGFAVQHDIPGMIELFGGREAFLGRLDEIMNTPPVFHVGAYNQEIHEMTEMAAAHLGQYAQSNQPSHHLPWLYTAVGAREKAAHYVRRAATELYSPDRFPGDEDNGEMSAWYIFAVLGFYPVSPGKPEYITAKPLVDKIAIKLENNRQLTIHRIEGYDPANDFISHHKLTNSPKIDI